MKRLPKEIATLVSKPVAVLGVGVSGQAVVALLEHLGISFVAYDAKEGDGVEREFSIEAARNHDLVIYSPGFSPQNAWIKTAQSTGAKLLSETDFAALFWTGKLIAVTGTNGKTTLTEFLAFALKRNGENAVAVGNNGFPLSRVVKLPEQQHGVAICEISSFQSEVLNHFKPDAVLWTNFDEDHLDRHDSMESYFRAKYNLVKNLPGSKVFVGSTVAAFAEQYGLALPEGTTVVAGAEKVSFPRSSAFSAYPQRENYQIATAYWKSRGLAESSLRGAALAFAPRQHRLTLVRELNQVEYWNDSKATNFHATLAALKDFDRPVLWIGGGKSKGGDVTRFADSLSEHVRRAYLIGETAPKLAKALAEKGIHAELCKGMKEAVTLAYSQAKAGDLVLFSPGFASQDMFENYVHRGVTFENVVSSLETQFSQMNLTT